jgi:amino acid adenylation domain-containing protein
MTDRPDNLRRIARLSPQQRARLEQRLAERGRPGTQQSIPARPAGLAAPLSYSQERLWFLAQLEPESFVFNRPFSFRIQGRLNLGALRQAIVAIVERHEVLRTVYSSDDGQPRQVVLPSAPIELDPIEVAGRDPVAREETLRARLLEECRRQFDLVRGPVLSVRLFRLADEYHVLFVNVHHIAFDGWSAELWLKEMSSLYHAFADGQPSPLDDLPLQYADYASWARQRYDKEALAPHLAYWRRNLQLPLPRLDLPFDRERPTARSHRGAHSDVQLPPEMVIRIAEECRRRRTTPFVWLVSAFGALLHRYTGQTDIILGTPTANREQPETERLIGFFVNMLPLRMDIEGRQSFKDLCAAVGRIVLEAQAHGDVPFEMLVAEVQPERDLRFPPIFQVLFNYKNLGLPTPAPVSDPTISGFEFQSGIAQFDLAVEITPAEGGLRCRFEYDADLFEAATIARLMGHYTLLLHATLEDPSRSIGGVDLVTAEERSLLLEQWTCNALPYPENATVIDLMEAVAARSPQQTALISGEMRVTFAELNARANQLARLLQQQGLKPGERAAVYLERSSESVVAVLAVLKAGGVLLLLDPNYPKDVTRHTLEEARVGMLVTRTRWLDRLGVYEGNAICLEEHAQQLQPMATADLGVRRGLDSAAYIIYTSGTTGWPKGIVVPHRQLAIGMAWLHKAQPMGESGIGAHRAPLGFQDALWEIFAALTQGSALAILEEEVVRDPRQLVDVVSRERVSWMVAVPGEIRAWLDLKVDLAARLPRLNTVISTGEVLTGELSRRFAQRMPHTHLCNFYGAAETGDVAWYSAEAQHRHLPRCPVGRPVANVRCYILDEQLRPVPIGLIGELYVSSSGLAREYLDDPELTAQRFIPCPFEPGPGSRMYRTGDLARFLPTGEIDIVGRADEQVKLNGVRIEPEQIEGVLRGHPLVEEARVDVRTDPSGEQRLIAYVVGRAEPDALRELLRQRVPRYMLPHLFLRLEALPRTPSGKVNRRALVDPDWSRRPLAQLPAAPRDAIERHLAAVWSGLLGVAQVGVHDDFFDLGGHSLLAARLMARVDEDFDVSLPLAFLFEHSTIAGMADALRAQKGAGGWDPLVAISPAGEGLPFFVVHGMLGNVVHLHHLAHALEPNHPFFGLQARGLDGNETPLDRVEAMAADYLRAIRRQQPHGPYFLGGYSFGGLVAFEMAQQLTAMDEHVGALVLFDTKLVRMPEHTGAKRGAMAALKRESRGLPRTLAYMRTLSFRQQLSFLRRKIEVFSGAQLGVRVSRHRLPRLPRNLPPASMVVFHACRDAMLHYVARPYPGSVILVLPDLQPDYSVRTDEQKVLDWSALALGGLDVLRVSGSKGTMIAPPKVTWLAHELSERFARAEARHPGG